MMATEIVLLDEKKKRLSQKRTFGIYFVRNNLIKLFYLVIKLKEFRRALPNYNFVSFKMYPFSLLPFFTKKRGKINNVHDFTFS